MQDVVLYQKRQDQGFGLISGVRTGQLYLIDRLHYFDREYAVVKSVYHQMQIHPYREYIGIFSAGTDTLPFLQHSGLFLMIQETILKLFTCLWVNGGKELTIKSLESDDDKE